MKERHFNGAFAPDRQSVTLTIDDTVLELDTSQVSSLIIVLAKIREAMSPQIEADAPMKFEFQVNPRFEVKGGGPMGGVFIGTRHPGLGWIFGQFPQESVESLITGLQKSFAQIPPPKGLQ